ncbi:DNA translocase FtsK [Candidatus Anaplasma sp. TIGMIC]|uniref:DNA translocase FtsK n=1 Tax=Candidatus Anaplasma sp. TIGMIC TaxID=3020713 RepID=UPI002A465E38|nr:DNA translocase FtsK 4TM domain-containing protein [Candidatus Anaplasma sp. TIGMIC]
MFRSIVLKCFVVFLVASVLTYDVHDHSLNSSGSHGEGVYTTNLMGTVGAYVADILVQVFGFAGFIPGVYLLFGYRNLPNACRKAYVPCMIVLTACVSGMLSKASWKIASRFHYGGIVGHKLAGLSYAALLSVAIVCFLVTIGWSAIIFLSKSLTKLLSELRMRTSASRIRKNSIPVVPPCSEEAERSNSHPLRYNLMEGHNPSIGVPGASACDDALHSSRKCSSVVSESKDPLGAVRVIFPNTLYKRYEERRQNDAECGQVQVKETQNRQIHSDERSWSCRDSEAECGMGDDEDDAYGVPRTDDAVGAGMHDEDDDDVEGEYHASDSEEWIEERYDIDEVGGLTTGCSGSFAPHSDVHSPPDLTSVTHQSDICEDSEDDFVAENFDLPTVDLLEKRKNIPPKFLDSSLYKDESEELYAVLKDFGVYGKIIDVRYGPVVTLYEFEPSAGTKSSRIIGLAEDIARSMSAISTRISVIPGRNVLGIELPNRSREIVVLRDLVESKEYADPELKLPIILGKGIDGEPVVGDLTRMPHLLIAGTTGSGKSVGINTMILSLLYRLTPEQCRMIMIDPKVLELSVYDNIPHLLTPVVTEAKKAVAVLKWVVAEMEERYRLMSAVGVRNITGYNEKIADACSRGESFERIVPTGYNRETGEALFENQRISNVPLPYIVVVVDEMADLMIVSGKEIESSIQRLSQMARAAGIHIIMATQRPSVDVITGVIKANFPTRISFSVTSKVDSRTILGEQGAEQLLGMGDMLYMVAGGKIRRIHGAYVSDSEVQDVVNHLRVQGRPRYVEDIVRILDSGDELVDSEDFDCKDDALYEKAVAIVLRDKKASVSYVQRQLRIGYNRAANLVERMEREGVITSAGHLGKREVVN